jgi:hypothetical protein
LEFVRRPVLQKLENTTFRKGGGGKTPTQLGTVESPNLNHWTKPIRFATAI